MQPYFFPYVGYFQLMAASDVFVILDDVQYIKGGWINRNRILVEGAPTWLGRPVTHAPHTLAINQRSYVADADIGKRLLRRIDNAYRRAPMFDVAYPIVEQLMAYADCNVAAFNAHLLRSLAQRLGLKARIVVSSEIDKSPGLDGPDRVFDICARLGASQYVNSIGGTALYDQETFAAKDLGLRFLLPQVRPYKQFDAAHVPSLSIIDAMMFNDLGALQAMCGEYQLVDGDGHGRNASQTRRRLVASGLFDAEYYLATNPDVSAQGADPLDHYIALGDAEGRSPNSGFKVKTYRRRYMGGEPPGANSLEHYAERGEKAGAAAGPLFRAADYLAKNPALTEAAERPLLHWLTVGRAQGLVASTLPGAEWAHLFDRPLRRSLYELMRFKRALIAAHGLERGFREYQDFLALPDSEGLRHKPLASQRSHVAEHGLVYDETDKGGVALTLDPPPVLGTGNHRTFHFVSRSRYVGCVADARLRGGSSLVELKDAVLFDYEGSEMENFDTEVDFDAAVFAETSGGAWMIIPPQDRASIEVDEAFSLLGVRSIAFGHWVSEHLLRYAEARLSPALPQVPVLIDEVMPPSHRRSLEVLFPGIEILVVPAYKTVKVGKLWVAPSLFFASLHERRNERFKWDFLTCSAERAAPAMKDLGERAGLAVGDSSGPQRLYLARRPGGHRQMVNHAEIEALAADAGFETIHPERLDFLEQIRLARNARCVVAPEGSAVFLTYFARPGTTVAILTNPFTDGTVGYRPFLDAIDARMLIVAGRMVKHDADFEEWSDYEIPAELFQRALAELERR